MLGNLIFELHNHHVQIELKNFKPALSATLYHKIKFNPDKNRTLAI